MAIVTCLFFGLCCLVSVGAFQGIRVTNMRSAVIMNMGVIDGGVQKALSAFSLGLLLPGSLDTSSGLLGSQGFHVRNSVSVVQPAMATEDVIYKSGKTPEKFKNKNKDDKTGTKKESKFLRCLSNCKSECQKPKDGLAALDCNQDCQDQCCESYEQCSFKIRTRSNEM